MAARFPRRLVPWATALLLVAGLLLPMNLLRTAPAGAAVADAAVVTRGAQWFVRGGPSFVFGISSDVQVMGDWDGNGTRTPGVFRNGTWHLKNALAGGAADVTLTFGRAGDTPVVGNWDGVGGTGLGVVRGGTWFLRNTLSSGAAEVSFTFGRAGDTKVAGD